VSKRTGAIKGWLLFMPTVKINLVRSERTILPDGDYQVRIEVADMRTSQRGNPTLHIEMVTEGNEDSTLDGVRLFRDQGMGPESAFYIAELARAVYGDIEGDEDGEFEFNTDDLMDIVLGCRVTIDSSYDGRERNRVDGFFSADEFGSEDFTDGDTEEEPSRVSV